MTERPLSVRGQGWLFRPVDDRRALALAQRHDLPPPVARILAARLESAGMEDAATFLRPTLRAQLPDPSCLQDMDRASERLAHAARTGEGIAILGDYDVDGATSTALLIRFFRSLGITADFHIPNRVTEGYGPNTAALRELRARGAKVVITVDCGITAFGPLEDAAREGLDVIVVDHHTAEARLPPAAAVVNPARLDDDSGCGHLAAVGVAFLLAVGVSRALRRAGWYDSRPEPDLRQLLDLVALGTVCDVVPLAGVNRALVAGGLKIMAARRNAGLAALADVAALDGPPDAGRLAFALGPRINAGGRVGESTLGTQLLATDDPAEARTLAARLNALNHERREREAACLAEATAQVEWTGQARAPVIYVSSADWHPGVIGIVAGRLKDRYGRPACVVAFDGQGVGRGSGRSVEGVDLGAAVIAARQAGLISAGGGHRMAAGFTVTRAESDAFHDWLSARVAALGGVTAPTLWLDGALAPEGVNAALVESLERLGPFGAGNPTPRFMLSRAVVEHAAPMGNGEHLRCRIRGEDGGAVAGVAFRCAGQPLGDFLLGAAGGPAVHLAGRAQMNAWRGQATPQFLIEDAAPATHTVAQDAPS